MSEGERAAITLDLFYWFSHYASSDLVSAGMPEAEANALLLDLFKHQAKEEFVYRH